MAPIQSGKSTSATAWRRCKEWKKCENRTFEKKLFFSSKTKTCRYCDSHSNPGSRSPRSVPKHQFSRFGGANLHFWAASFPSHSNPIVVAWYTCTVQKGKLSDELGTETVSEQGSDPGRAILQIDWFLKSLNQDFDKILWIQDSSRFWSANILETP